VYRVDLSGDRKVRIFVGVRPYPILDEVEAITGHSRFPGPTGADLDHASPRVVWMVWFASAIIAMI
jgi:hypothetical protein